MIKRREFIAGLGGAAAWPVVARAQQPGQMKRVGVLLPAGPDDSQYQTLVGAFLQRLGQLGWTIGRNVRIDIRWAGVNAEDIRKHAAELVSLAPEVIWPRATRS
jgi:putative ABC transport system substrate-binding protein